MSRKLVVNEKARRSLTRACTPAVTVLPAAAVFTQNVFDDFISGAKYLCTINLTTPAQLAINGGSNGGLVRVATARSSVAITLCQDRTCLYVHVRDGSANGGLAEPGPACLFIRSVICCIDTRKCYLAVESFSPRGY